ncbi:hypothetical protein BLA50215_02195 [Burkholderia lata]|uniref:hypothetical protein n=1 Tax=Burkholderia lata (strain ATCC 17760 / DSM 23089 / LMG 22485 / NCIMB 9086 / R18194 / 383) TaxID=482957 RepID=UPI0014530311|nr:hypothetical protein [Burkholderia lata]VWC95356.1 hypothetical protein BLA50215_02195 [Burkholderia lata]
MNTGIVIYGTDPDQAALALTMAENLFVRFGKRVSRAGVLKFVFRGDENFVDDREVLPVDLMERISTGEITAFQVYGSDSAISFGYNVPEYGGLSFIDAQIEGSVYKMDEEVGRFLWDVARYLNFKYAIAYDAENLSAAYKYSTGVNLVRIFPFENTSLFTRELPGRSPGSVSYEGAKLRMVYPLNVLNESHLEICLNDLSLREWIGADSSRGSLKSLPNNMWLWSVKETDLLEVNSACGEARILLAWQKSPGNRPVRQLP